MVHEKRLIVLFSVLTLVFLTISSVSALSIQELIDSLWVNAALVFLLLFNIILFAVKNVFKKSYGAAVIISMIISLMCTVGLVASFGSFFSRIGLWLVILVVLAIALLSLRFAKGKGVVFFIVFAIAALAWLAFFHNSICPPRGTLSEDACQVIDVLALIIVIVLFFRFLFWLVKRLGKPSFGGGFDKGQKPDKPWKPGRPDKPGKPDKPDKPDRNKGGDDGTLVGKVVDQTGLPIEGVSISVTKSNFVIKTVPTDVKGNYGMNLPGGRNFAEAWSKYRYKITAHKPGYRAKVRYVAIMSNRTRIRSFSLKKLGPDVPATKKLVVEMYANGVANRNAGEIRVKPNTYPNVRTSSVPFKVLKENPGFKFRKWVIHHVTKKYTEPPRTSKNFLLSMDGDCKVEAHFSSGNTNNQSNMGKISLSVSKKQVPSGKKTVAYASWAGGTAPFYVTWYCPRPLQYFSQKTNKSPIRTKFTVQGNPGQAVPVTVVVRDANGTKDAATKKIRILP